VTKDRIFKTFAQSFLEVSPKPMLPLRLNLHQWLRRLAPAQTSPRPKHLIASPVPGVSTMQFFNDESGTSPVAA